MKLALQCFVGTSGSGLVAVTIGGAQPHDPVKRLQLGAWTGLRPYPQVVDDLWPVEAAGTVRDELSTSPC